MERRTHSDVLKGRLSFKCISNRFLEKYKEWKTHTQNIISLKMNDLFIFLREKWRHIRAQNK